MCAGSLQKKRTVSNPFFHSYCATFFHFTDSFPSALLCSGPVALLACSHTSMSAVYLGFVRVFFLFCFFCPLFCFFCIFMMFYACVFLLCVYVLNIDALSEPHLHRSERHSFLTDSQCDTFKIISASRLRRVSQTQPRTRTRA